MTESSDEGSLELPQEPKLPDVLIIDQDEVNLMVIKQVLSDLYEVATATNARDAFRIVDEGSIKVIIADHELPRMTGLRFFEELEQNGPQNQLPRQI